MRCLSEEPDFNLLRGASFPGMETQRRGLKTRMGVALLLALLAPALGGGTSPTAEAVLLAGAGLAVLALPARRVQVGFLVGAGLLLAVTLDWAWPARLGHMVWRAELEEAGFPLGWCSSPQPWVSLRAWLLLPGGLVWAGWCAGQEWTRRGRRGVCEGLAVGVGLIAGVAILARNGHVPGWPKGTGLGPFENRNQTATLFATGAFLTVACGMERLRKWAGGKMGPLMLWGLAWFCLLGIYTVALALNRSRSGPLLFAGMTLLWVLVRPSWKRKPETLAVGLAAALLLGTIFLLAGRGVIIRLEANPIMDFRLKIFSDTFGLIRGSAWTGTGLGCFGAIFPIYRNASILQERVLHPESDWLWLAAEAGLPGLLAAVGLVVWLGLQALRGLARGKSAGDRAMRLALCVACLGVLAHSFADVPGHRLGTMMPALLLLGLAAEPNVQEERWTTAVLRGMGLAVLVLGVATLVALELRVPTPLVNGEEVLATRALKEEAAGRHADAKATMGKVLDWAPLDWKLYVERAQMEGEHGEWTAALGDFRRARFLEPNYAGLPFSEGVFWIAVAPRFAIEAWEEALHRTPRETRPELYQNMLAHAFASHPEMHWALWLLASSDYQMQLVYLGWATPAEFKAELDEALHQDPALRRFNTGQLRRLFSLWMDKGDTGRLAYLLARRPDWLKAGYRTLAKYDAARGNLSDALDLMERYLPTPLLPRGIGIRHGEAASRYAEDKGDVAAGLVLYDDAVAAGHEEQALETLKEMSTNPHCPAYVHYIEGQLLVKEGKLEEAWNALEQCPDGDQR